MKRIAFLLLTIAIILCSTSCAKMGNNDLPTDTPNTNENTNEDLPPITKPVERPTPEVNNDDAVTLD